MENTNHEEKINNTQEPVMEVKEEKTKEVAEVIDVKDWMITLLLTFIPVVNIVMYFVWAFSKGENPNKANWAKANLIWAAIFIGLAILLFVAMASFVSSMLK